MTLGGTGVDSYRARVCAKSASERGAVSGLCIILMCCCQTALQFVVGGLRLLLTLTNAHLARYGVRV
jgi:hypothetical protein